MNWKELWMTLFGRTQWLGLDVGFWVSFFAVLKAYVRHYGQLL